VQASKARLGVNASQQLPCAGDLSIKQSLQRLKRKKKKDKNSDENIEDHILSSSLFPGRSWGVIVLYLFLLILFPVLLRTCPLSPRNPCSFSGMAF
jgi:hypothetical protein